ncbi:sulfatase [Halorubrum sp. AJ67]|uniref:sulfatase n=1 Tax=Halorubrum sp. AJ67 TaxID=1173487 RepID=UPI0003DD826E|nr:sulfatase [Halorubrum sp. AJ67]CDK39326.1 sulfatase family protein [Halorubrum sp. AJ67]
MKNIVLLTFDSLRADHCSHHGYDRDTTPNLADIAQNGISFSNAVSPASRTNPSMSGIFTGEHIINRDKISNPEHSKYHLNRHGTFVEELSEKGYSTAAFCPNAYSSRYYGFDNGFDKFEDFMFSSEKYKKLFDRHITESSVYTAVRNLRNLIRKEEAFRLWETYIDNIEQWAEKSNKPFFLWAFALDTHFPYIVPRNQQKWSNLLEMYYYNWRCNQLLDKFDIQISEREKQGIMNIYDDSIRYADLMIKEVKKRLDKYDPVYIITSDHGEAIGERGIYGHFYPSLYEENIHVPLVIGGNIEQTKTIDNPTSLTELYDMVISISETGSISYNPKDIVFATTYDGRRERNLFTYKTKSWKYHYILEDGTEQKKLFNMDGNLVEPENEVENEPVSSALGALADRRKSHEEEIIQIRESVKTID